MYVYSYALAYACSSFAAQQRHAKVWRYGGILDIIISVVWLLMLLGLHQGSISNVIMRQVTMGMHSGCVEGVTILLAPQYKHASKCTSA